MGNLWQNTSTLIGSLTLGAIASLPVTPVSLAQGTLPTCASPKAMEFLVLVFTPSEPLQKEVQLQVGRSLSKDHKLLVCEYGGNVLSRVGGFDSLASATKWAEYFDQAVGLPLMVITPVDGEKPRTATTNPPTMPTQTTIKPPELVVATEETGETFQTQLKPERKIPVSTLMTQQNPNTGIVPPPPPFQPKALSGGYGVLVDYGANPAIATQLKTLLSKDVGLVVYASHGYLLAEQTKNSDRVTELLNLLNQNDLGAIAVPADQLISLKAIVRY